MSYFTFICQHFRIAFFVTEWSVSCIATGMLVLLSVIGISVDCLAVEQPESATKRESGVTEAENISPDYTLERSEQEFIQYTGMFIRSIQIKRLEVFDSSVNDTTRVETSGLKKVLNRINFNTREITIRENLLFNEGDSIDPYVLADSERLLRDLNFIKDARIIVIPDIANADSVSVLVIVKDQWSLVLSGGLKKANGFRLSMTDANILGLGHEISSAITRIPHTTPRLGISYSVQNIKGSFVTGKMTFLKVPDNNTEGLEFSRELVSPVLKYSGGLELRRTSERIHDSLPFFTDNAYNLIDFWIGKTIHFRSTNWSIDRRRILVISGRFRQTHFTKHPFITDSTRYRYHDKSYYLGNIAFSQNRYYRTNLLYSYNRTENIPYGFLANVTSGMLDDHTHPRWYVSTDIAAGKRIKRLGYGAVKLSLSGCPRSKSIELGILKLQSLYFTDIMQLGDFRFRQFLKMEYTTGIHRFSDDSIDFTAEESIRGVRYNHRVTGTHRMFFNLDTVMFTPWEMQGVTFAFFTFADVDIISPNYKKIITQNYYSGLGFGVRIHSNSIGIETVQIRFSWYPNLPLDHNAYTFTSSREQLSLPIDFVGSKPEILDY